MVEMLLQWRMLWISNNVVMAGNVAASTLSIVLNKCAKSKEK